MHGLQRNTSKNEVRDIILLSYLTRFLLLLSFIHLNFQSQTDKTIDYHVGRQYRNH